VAFSIWAPISSVLWFRKEPTQALPPELLDDVEPPELPLEEVELPELLDEVPDPEPPDDPPPPPQAASTGNNKATSHPHRILSSFCRNWSIVARLKARFDMSGFDDALELLACRIPSRIDWER
jgi:hypothetical protein